MVSFQAVQCLGPFGPSSAKFSPFKTYYYCLICSTKQKFVITGYIQVPVRVKCCDLTGVRKHNYTQFFHVHFRMFPISSFLKMPKQ